MTMSETPIGGNSNKAGDGGSGGEDVPPQTTASGRQDSALLGNLAQFETKLYASASAYAERACPGVLQRVSGGDLLAIIGGTLRATVSLCIDGRNIFRTDLPLAELRTGPVPARKSKGAARKKRATPKAPGKSGKGAGQPERPGRESKKTGNPAPKAASAKGKKTPGQAVKGHKSLAPERPKGEKSQAAASTAVTPVQGEVPPDAEPMETNKSPRKSRRLRIREKLQRAMASQKWVKVMRICGTDPETAIAAFDRLSDDEVTRLDEERQHFPPLVRYGLVDISLIEGGTDFDGDTELCQLKAQFGARASARGLLPVWTDPLPLHPDAEGNVWPEAGSMTRARWIDQYRLDLSTYAHSFQTDDGSSTLPFVTVRETVQRSARGVVSYRYHVKYTVHGAAGTWRTQKWVSSAGGRVLYHRDREEETPWGPRLWVESSANKRSVEVNTPETSRSPSVAGVSPSSERPKATPRKRGNPSDARPRIVQESRLRPHGDELPPSIPESATRGAYSARGRGRGRGDGAPPAQ